jgi:hypothetical protein
MSDLMERKSIESAWAKHLTRCMDVACTTCDEFSAKIYG